MCGFAAIESFRYSSVNRAETRVRYVRYARRTWTCSQVSPPTMTRRLRESTSASPRHIAPERVADRLGDLFEVEHRPRASRTPKSWMNTRPSPSRCDRDLLDDPKAE